MKKSDDWDDIKVNRRSSDRVCFESNLIQQIYDGIDYLRSEGKDILMELDKKGIDDFDLEDFGEKTLNQIDDIVDDIDDFREEMDLDDIPEFVKNSSKNAKVALNRDSDYVRKAKRRLKKAEGEDGRRFEKINLKVVKLCDKAVYVNELNFEAYYVKARALVNLKKYDEAIDALISCLSVNRDYVDAWLLIGDVNRLNSDFEDAISIYDRVLEDNEGLFEALVRKARVYCDMGLFAEADDFFKRADAVGCLDDSCVECWEFCKLNLG